MRLRSSDIRRADSTRAFDKVMKLLEGATTADEIIERCRREAKRLGLRIVTKSSTSLQWSKFTTTFYKEIRLGSEFHKKAKWQQAATWAHEMVHVYQWRLEGRARFGSRYVFRTRYRWAYEVEGYRMSVHIRERLKVPRAWTRAYIFDRPNVLRKSYALHTIRRNDLTKHTIEILGKALGKDPYH